MALAIASTSLSSFPTNREIPRKFKPGKVNCLLGRTRLNATKGASSVCEPLPPDRPLWFPGSSPPEWLDGSLPGDFGFDPLGLGDRGISHAELNWPTRLKIIQGVARGMGFIHSEFASYEVPHGNLKSSNILIDSNYEPLLNDYAFHPLINNTQTVQSLFAYKSPEAILYQQVSPKSDVFCFGIIILELFTGKFPSQYLNNQKGGTDVVQWVRSAISEKRESELIDPEIAATAKDSIGKMENLLHIGAACTESDHDKRIDMKEAIKRIEEIQV